MNWLKNFVRPKLKELVGGQKEIPDNLWHKCPSCTEMIFHRDLEKNLKVCPHCGFHMRIGAAERLQYLFDNGEYQSIELAEVAADPLKFRDQKKYTDRLKEAQNKTGLQDALTVAHGRMGGLNVVIAALDFSFMGGSMGIAVGEGLVTASRLAVVQDAPLIVVPSSGGARMQEGILSLMQMARTTIAVEEVKDAGLPTWSSSPTRPPAGSPPPSPCWATWPSPRPARSSASPEPGSSSRPSARNCPTASSGRNTCSNTAWSTWWSAARNCARP